MELARTTGLVATLAISIAVLIDADNTSPRSVPDLLEEIAKYGTPTVERAYGDWTTQNLAGWKSELLKHAIQPQQQFAYTTREELDRLLADHRRDGPAVHAATSMAFAIVSSDSDFTRLATRLREGGATVYGLGQRKTPEPFRAACDRFIFLDLRGTRSRPSTSPDLQRPHADGGRRHLARTTGGRTCPRSGLS